MTSSSNPARLLNIRDAAAYCSMSRGTFLRVCPVMPVKLGPDARLLRYDINALNGWIDELNGQIVQPTDWLSKFESHE